MGCLEGWLPHFGICYRFIIVSSSALPDMIAGYECCLASLPAIIHLEWAALLGGYHIS